MEVREGVAGTKGPEYCAHERPRLSRHGSSTHLARAHPAMQCDICSRRHCPAPTVCVCVCVCVCVKRKKESAQPSEPLTSSLSRGKSSSVRVGHTHTHTQTHTEPCREEVLLCRSRSSYIVFSTECVLYSLGPRLCREGRLPRPRGRHRRSRSSCSSCSSPALRPAMPRIPKRPTAHTGFWV